MISVQDARGLLTKGVVATYKEVKPVGAFLMSFFTPVESMTKTVSIEVRRNNRSIAVDVKKHDSGNYNKFTKSTEKIIEPPMYHEYMIASDHELYDVAVNDLQNGGTTFFPQLIEGLASDNLELIAKIEEAKEKQCADILEFGTVVLENNVSLDYGRKAASLVAYNASTDFSIGTVNPYKVIEDGCQFIKTTGKAQGAVFNCLMGSATLSAFLNNTIVKERSDIRNFSLDAVAAPQRNAVGASFHGEVSCGSYIVRLWSYPETYTKGGSDFKYLNDKKLVLLPETTNFKMVYAAVPQLIENGGTIPQKGQYLMSEYFDQRNTAHEMHIKSRPIAVPVAIDQIYTLTVLN